MKKIVVLSAAMVLAGTAVLAQADTAKKPVTDWTCEEFLSVDTVSQPAVVGYVQALNSKGQPEEGMFDVVTATRVSQLTADECKVEPKASFMNKLRTIWEKQGK
jgi:acid stress chaperone HdeA